MMVRTHEKLLLSFVTRRLIPIFLTGLRLALHSGGCVQHSDGIEQLVEPYEETNQQLNLTPKFSFVDLHIGEPTNQCV
jgi:hypothetical protein